jgi:predicted neuraminidase
MSPLPLLFVLAATAMGQTLNRNLAVMSEELIGTPTTAYNHASTIAEAADGTLVVAWFGGSLEGADDVSIWMSRNSGSGWSPIVEIDDGRRPDGNDYSCWNPVLIAARNGTLYLFYKISSQRASVTLAGYQNWWGCVKMSTDNGLTWSARQWLPTSSASIYNNFGNVMTGPVKNKPLELPDGTLLSGSSTEAATWQAHVEIGAAGNWLGSASLAGPLQPSGAIQPTFLVHSADFRNLRMICRAQSGNNPFTATSSDMGRTWTTLTRLTGLNTSVGLDAVTLSNGWHLLAHNLPPNRYPLVLSRSQNGTTWEQILPNLDVSGTLRMDYPAIIQTRDGRIHITHSWDRSHIKHLVLNQNYLTGTTPIKLQSRRRGGERIGLWKSGMEDWVWDMAGRIFPHPHGGIRHR